MSEHEMSEQADSLREAVTQTRNGMVRVVSLPQTAREARQALDLLTGVAQVLHMNPEMRRQEGQILREITQALDVLESMVRAMERATQEADEGVP